MRSISRRIERSVGHRSVRRRGSVRLPPVAAALLAMGAAFAQAGEIAPVGEEFEIGTENLGYPRVAVDDQGDFVVVWNSDTSEGTDTNLSSIQARIFEADAVPDGARFQVNAYTTGFQWHPDVTVDAQGNFFAVWSGKSATSFSGIQGRRFDLGGNPVGTEFPISEETVEELGEPAIATGGLGDFVVVWSNDDDSAKSIHARRFDLFGDPVGSEFQVNTTPAGDEYVGGFHPRVAMDAFGPFVVVWQSFGSEGSDSSQWSIQARRFDENDDPVGGQFQVNAYTTGTQWKPDVASNEAGGFVVVWESSGSFGTDTSQSSIHGQK
jgi:hypothetical protein